MINSFKNLIETKSNEVKDRLLTVESILNALKGIDKKAETCVTNS